MNSNYETTHEIDIVTLKIEDENVVISLYECSKNDSKEKCLSDIAKLKELTELIDAFSNFRLDCIFVGPEKIESDFNYINMTDLEIEIEDMLKF